MDYQFIANIGVGIILLLGLYPGIKFYIKNKNIILTKEEEFLVEQIKKIAKYLIKKAQNQCGENEEIQKETIIKQICEKYPRLNKSIIKIAIDKIYKELNEELNKS